MIIESPGSISDYAEQRGISLEQAQAFYPDATQEYRDKLAEFLGLTLDQLHDITEPITKNPTENVEQ